MGLPKITFVVASDGLGQTQADIQKIPGMVLTGETVAGTGNVTAGIIYQIFALSEAEAMGITAAGTNAYAHKQISDFYAEAKTGAELWFVLAPSTVNLATMADLSSVYAKKLLVQASGKVRVLGIGKKAAANDVVTQGLDVDVHNAVIKAQELASDFAERYQPVRCVIGGNKYSGVVADLKDYSQTDFDRCAILISNNDASAQGGIGSFIGRLASIPTQRKVWRVKDGPIENTGAYFTNSTPVDNLSNTWDAIHDKGYIFHRTYTGKTGFYFSSDKTLAKAENDFNTLSRGLVMDEAIIIAYNKLIDNLGDEVPVTASGTIHPAIIKSWQGETENELRRLMVDTGKLSDVKVFIDENQTVVSDGNFKVGIQLLPIGYAEYITVYIGFTTNIE